MFGQETGEILIKNYEKAYTKKKKCDRIKAEVIFMWLAYAFLSAFFAGICAVLSKVGMTGINSNLGTAIRTGVVFIFAWLMVFVAGAEAA